MICLAVISLLRAGDEPPPFVFTFAAAGVVLVLGIWAIGRTLSRRRTQALADAAVRIGFVFGGEDWPDKDRAPLLETALFGKGRDHKINNVMSGSAAGFRASLFDYTFVVGGGRNSRRYMQTVATFSKDGASLPYFELRPANLLSRAWDAVAHKDIRFDGNPEFAQRYVLRGALPEKVHELFTPGLISFFDALDAREKWHIEGTDDTLVVYRMSKKVAPEKLRDFLDQTSAIASAFFSFAGAPAAITTSP
ncbi:MAG TPA: hypothetical protein VFU57_04045 [Candidatus Acidoferrales bacterium]|nr:hypothetical protein [Candidatus Acidoferrales bacterium]